MHTESLELSGCFQPYQRLHPDYAGGLCYFATGDFFYVVKTLPHEGLVYYKTRNLESAGEQAIVPISESVAAFLQNKLLLKKGMFYP